MCFTIKSVSDTMQFILSGPFHTGMNFMGMLGKKCRGSGYQEILLEAGLVTSGSINSVMSGRAYNKALFCLKSVTEALERLLFEVFVEQRGDELQDSAVITSLFVSPDRDQLMMAIHDPVVTELIKDYMQFEDKVRQGLLGKTAVFWISVIDQAHLLFMLQHAVKINDFDLFHYCNGKMADLFFAFDGQNYARYVIFFIYHLKSNFIEHQSKQFPFDKINSSSLSKL